MEKSQSSELDVLMEEHEVYWQEELLAYLRCEELQEDKGLSTRLLALSFLKTTYIGDHILDHT